MSGWAKLPNNTFEKLNSIDFPIVQIGGFGINNSKFELELELYKQLFLDGYIVKAITYNELGLIFDFETYQYPEKIVFPDIVYCINNSVKKFDCEILLLGMPGSICRLSEENNNNFGVLYQAYMKALSIDVFILTINCSITLKLVHEQIKMIKGYGINNIALFISPITYDGDSLNSEIKYFIANHNRINNYYKLVKEEFTEYKIFLMDDLKNSILKNFVIELLS